MNNFSKAFRYIFFILVFFIIQTIAKGQAPRQSGATFRNKGESKFKISAGFKVGICDTKQYIHFFKEFGSTAPKMGAYVGVPIEIAFRKTVALQLEPAFIQKNIFYSLTSIGYSESTDINYIELPVFLKLIATTYRGKIRFNLIAGPSAAIGLNGSSKPSNGNAHGLEFSHDHYSRYDYCMNIGTGVQVHLKTAIVIVDFRYSYGIKDVVTDNQRIQNKGMITTVGLLF